MWKSVSKALMPIVDERNRYGYIPVLLEEFEHAYGDEVLAAADKVAVDNTRNEKRVVIAVGSNLHNAKKPAMRTNDDPSCHHLRDDGARNTLLALAHNIPCMLQETLQLHWYHERIGFYQAHMIHFVGFAAYTAYTDPLHCSVRPDRDSADALVVEVEPMK
jgi:hypothetical protein